MLWMGGIVILEDTSPFRLCFILHSSFVLMCSDPESFINPGLESSCPCPGHLCSSKVKPYFHPQIGKTTFPQMALSAGHFISTAPFSHQSITSYRMRGMFNDCSLLAASYRHDIQNILLFCIVCGRFKCCTGLC